jgi:hypothetical protein
MVHYTAYHRAEDGSELPQQGRIRIWTKQGKEGARQRVMAMGQKRGIRIQIWNIYQPGRTAAGLFVPEGMEEVPE